MLLCVLEICKIILANSYLSDKYSVMLFALCYPFYCCTGNCSTVLYFIVALLDYLILDVGGGGGGGGGL